MLVATLTGAPSLYRSHLVRRRHDRFLFGECSSLIQEANRGKVVCVVEAVELG